MQGIEGDAQPDAKRPKVDQNGNGTDMELIPTQPTAIDLTQCPTAEEAAQAEREINDVDNDDDDDGQDRQYLAGEQAVRTTTLWPARSTVREVPLPPGLAEQESRGRPTAVGERADRGRSGEFSLAPSNATAVTVSAADLETRLKHLELSVQATIQRGFETGFESLVRQVSSRFQPQIDDLQQRVGHLEKNPNSTSGLSEARVREIVRELTPPRSASGHAE
eukprot:6320840-Amphidinium_carterae.1